MITLNSTEQRLAKFIAKCRTAHDRSSGAKATVYGEQEHEAMELNSVGAELAFCKLFNCWPDMDTEHFGELDAILRDGRMVDVKCTARKHGRLLVKDKIRKPCDLYALMIGEFPSYRFAGWISGEELLRDERLDKALPHPAYAAAQSDLTIEFFDFD